MKEKKRGLSFRALGFATTNMGLRASFVLERVENGTHWDLIAEDQLLVVSFLPGLIAITKIFFAHCSAYLINDLCEDASDYHKNDR